MEEISEQVFKSIRSLVAVFQKLKSDLWARPPSPRFIANLSKTQDEDILALVDVTWKILGECVIKIIDNPDLNWKDVYVRSFSILENLDELTLAMLYFMHPNPNLLFSLMHQERMWFLVTQEMVSRIEKRRVGREVANALREDNPPPRTPNGYPSYSSTVK